MMTTKTLRTTFHRLWKSWGRDLVIVLGIMIPFRSSIADWNYVPTGSMVPSILEGDRILVNKLAYDLKIPLTSCAVATWADPERGDIVVLDSPADGKRLVKRVMGLPGETVAMDGGRLLVDGEPASYEDTRQHASYVFSTEIIDGRGHPVRFSFLRPRARSFDTIEIPEDHYLVLGDNRDLSADSRVFGLVERFRIVGQAPAVVVSFDRDRYYLPRGDRWFKSLP